MARQSTLERSCTVCFLIPVSGVGEVVDGVSEVVGETKIGGNGVEGMLRKETWPMTK